MIYHPKNNHTFTFNIYDFILCFQVGIMSSDSDDDIAPSAHTIKLLIENVNGILELLIDEQVKMKGNDCNYIL